MKKRILLELMGFCLLSSQICLAQTPHQVGGFMLGASIDDYKDKVRMETMMPIRYLESVQEVEIKPVQGFKSGLLSYGTCAVPGRIMRIKLKYAESSKPFYDELLKRFKARFGDPSEWRGDPFHIVVAWKWSLTDSAGNHVSLILQHNTRDEEEKIGNSLKLAVTNWFDAEEQCLESQSTRMPADSRDQEPASRGPLPDNWDLFIPQ